MNSDHLNLGRVLNSLLLLLDRRYTAEQSQIYVSTDCINNKLLFFFLSVDDDQLVDRNCACCAQYALPSYHKWVKFQHIVYKVANSSLFGGFIALCIAANTIIMATESYNACELCRLCGNTTCDLCTESCNFEQDSQIEWRFGMTKTHDDVINLSNLVRLSPVLV